MNETAKKGLLIAVAVIAVALLGWQISKFATADKMQIQGSGSVVPPGFKNEKERALEEKANGGTPAPQTGGKSEEDRDKALAGG
jgi:hypothetical protein